MSYYVLVSATQEPSLDCESESQRKKRTRERKYAVYVVSMHIFVVECEKHKTEECFILILLLPTHLMAQNKEAKSKTTERRIAKLWSKRKTRERQNICARTFVKGKLMLSTCNTQCVARIQQGFNIRQKHVSNVSRTTIIPSTGRSSEPVESVECFKSWCARRGWFKSL